jgi:glutamate-1-semialdehyde 2,1-aminomutase
MHKGVQKKDINNVELFNYNDIKSLQRVFDEHPNKIACVILEPSSVEHPQDNFLHKVKSLCKKYGAVFILDEMITGFRWHLKGAQHYYNIDADLCTFGKAMANGFSVAAVAGKREIMELGSIEFTGQERLFLLSTTHGAEMNGLGAFVESIQFMKDNNVVEHLWQYGRDFIKMLRAQIKSFELEDFFIVGGVECSPYYLTLDKDGNNSLGLRTLFAQEMTKNGIIMPWLAFSYAHGEKELKLTEDAISKTFKVYKEAVDKGYKKYLIGDSIKPVFRKYN